MNNKTVEIPKININPLIFIPFFILILIWLWYDAKYRYPERKLKIEHLNDLYFSSFNESFKGTIVHGKTFYMQNAGQEWLSVLKIKLFQSSINYYDIRNSSDDYYCVIDYPYAEVFISKEFDDMIKIGDSCEFNGHTDQFCIKSTNPDYPELKCWKPEIMNSNVRKIGKLFTIPKYSELERKIKAEGLKYETNNPDKFYRFYLGKFKTKEEIKTLLDKYEETFLIEECFENKAYIILKKNNANFLFHRLSFCNFNHIVKYYKIL